MTGKIIIQPTSTSQLGIHGKPEKGPFIELRDIISHFGQRMAQLYAHIDWRAKVAHENNLKITKLTQVLEEKEKENKALREEKEAKASLALTLSDKKKELELKNRALQQELDKTIQDNIRERQERQNEMLRINREAEQERLKGKLSQLKTKLKILDDEITTEQTTNATVSVVFWGTLASLAFTPVVGGVVAVVTGVGTGYLGGETVRNRQFSERKAVEAEIISIENKLRAF